MPAITIVTPGVKAERSWSPSSALAMSISAGNGMTTGSAGRCISVTATIPQRAARRRLGEWPPGAAPPPGLGPVLEDVQVAEHRRTLRSLHVLLCGWAGTMSEVQNPMICTNAITHLPSFTAGWEAGGARDRGHGPKPLAARCSPQAGSPGPESGGLPIASAATVCHPADGAALYAGGRPLLG